MPHVFEIEGILNLLAAAKKRDEQDWLMICVAFLHALRASEVTGGWTWHTDKKTKQITKTKSPGLMPSNVIGTMLKVKRRKNSNPVEDELVEHANPLLNERQALIDLCRRTSPNQRLFSISARTFQRRMHLYGEAAGLPKLYCHPHTLKHSVLTHLLKTMDLKEIQGRSGHKSLDSLSIYLHPKKAVVDAKVRDSFSRVAV